MSVIANGIGGFELGQNPGGTTSPRYYAVGGFNTSDLTAGAARSGNFGLNSNTSAQTNGGIWTIAPANTSLPASPTAWEGRYRMYFRPQSYPAANDVCIFELHTGANPFSLLVQMNTTGQLRIVPAFCGNTTSAYAGATSLNTWYYLLVRVYGVGAGGQADATKDSSCEVTLYDDDTDTQIVQFTDSLTVGQNMPNHWPSTLCVGQDAFAGTAAARHIQFDDVWWKETTDTDVTDLEWPRATRIYLFKPNGAGSSTQYTRGGTDTGANWSQVSDVPVSGTSDVRTAVVGNTDMYTHEPGITDENIYHIRAAGFWSDDSSLDQTIFIGADSYDSAAIITAQFGVADKAYSNGATLSKASFDAMQIGFKKKQGGGTMFVANFFLEVLSGPPPVFEEDLPAAGDPNAFAVTAAYDALGGLVNPGGDNEITLTPSTLGFRISGRGEEINVPTPWNIQQIQVGYRDEETA